MRDKEIATGALPVHIDRLVGLNIHPLRDGIIDCVDVGDAVHLFFKSDTLEAFGLAIMAYVEAQKAARQSAEDWDAERADAEAL